MFKSLTQLEYLDLSNTKLFGEFVSSAPKLKYLSLNKIELFELDISQIDNLEILNLEDCSLDVLLGLEKQYNLEVLNLKDNYMSKINVNELIKLDSINISRNEFSKIPLFPKKTIKYLNVSSNPIFDFSIKDLEILNKVKSVDLSYMALEKLPEGIYSCLLYTSPSPRDS